MFQAKVKVGPNFVLFSKAQTETDLDKWTSLKLELLKAVLQSKPGSLITKSLYTFEDNNICQDSAEQVMDPASGETTYTLKQGSWGFDDLKKIADSSQFELSELWMKPGTTLIPRNKLQFLN